MNEGKKYYKRLDLIRVISCFMVLFYHLNIIKGGFLAVCTFFVLSGYLEYLSAVKSDSFSIKKYYIKRLKRIYLPLLVVVSITVFLAKIIPNINWLNLKPESISSLLGYNNIWQLKANLNYFTKNVNSPLIHIWYISILMQFDLIFPFLFLLIRKIDKIIKHKISIIILFIFASLSTYYFYRISQSNNIMLLYYNTLGRSFSIFFGLFLASLHNNFGIRMSKFFRKTNTLLFVLYLIILILISIFLPSKSSYYVYFMILATFISCRMIKYSMYSDSGKKNRLISFFSKISYETYLVQYPVIFFIQAFKLSSIIKIPLIIIITIIVSFITHVIVSYPLKNKILKIIRNIVLSIIIITGIFIIVIEKDHRKEIAKLENKLNDNLKLMDEKNKNYKNSAIDEEKKWNLMLEDLDKNESEVVSNQLKELPVVGVGDSVFLDAINYIYKKFPNGYFDGKISRSLIGGIDVLENLKNSDKLSNTIVLALSTNGIYSDRYNKKLMELLEDRQIYWVNSVGGDDPSFNEKFANFAKDYSNIHIVDWQKVAEGHKEYFYSDGIHPKNNGLEIYANTIYETVYNDYLEKYREKRNEILKKKEEEKNKKIVFYGNDALANSYDYIQKEFDNALFNAKSNYSFNSLYNEMNTKVKNDELEHVVVFIFDNQLKITNNEYSKLISLCKNHEIYICNMTDKKLSFNESNVNIIDFNSELKKHDDYLMADKIHLTKKGNEALANIIFKSLNNK